MSAATKTTFLIPAAAMAEGSVRKRPSALSTSVTAR